MTMMMMCGGQVISNRVECSGVDLDSSGRRFSERSEMEKMS